MVRDGFGTTVLIDVDGDRTADMEILLEGVSSLLHSDLIL